MNYPILYSADETQFTSYGIAVLENARDVKITERLNGEYTLSLSIPFDDKYRHYILVQDFEYIKVNEVVFMVNRVSMSKDSEGMPEIFIEAEHIMYILRNSIVVYKEYFGKTLKFILEDLIGTHPLIDVASWQDDTILFDFEFNLKNVYECIYDIVTTIGGEIDCLGEVNNVTGKFDFGIRLPQYVNGVYVGGGKGTEKEEYHVRVGKNIRSIKKEIDKSEYFTKVYYFGNNYDEDTFSGHTITYGKDGFPLLPSEYITIPAGQNYLFDASATVDRVGFKQFTDITNRDELYWASLAHFESVRKPKITYDIDMVDLRGFTDFYQDLPLQLGDTVRFFPFELGGLYGSSSTSDDYEVVRVTELDLYPYEQEKTKVRFESVNKNVFYTFAEFVKTSRTVDSVTVNNNQSVNPEKLDGVNIRSKDVIPDSFNGDYGGNFVINGYRDGMLIARDNSLQKNAIFLGKDGSIWIYNAMGVGFQWDVSDSVPKVRYAGGGITSEILTKLNSIDALFDVDTSTTAPQVNQVLKWNGTKWIPSW